MSTLLTGCEIRGFDKKMKKIQKAFKWTMFGRQVTAWGSLGAEFNFTSNDLHAVTWRLQIFKFRAFLIFPFFFQTLLSYSLGLMSTWETRFGRLEPKTKWPRNASLNTASAHKGRAESNRSLQSVRPSRWRPKRGGTISNEGQNDPNYDFFSP